MNFKKEDFLNLNDDLQDEIHDEFSLSDDYDRGFAKFIDSGYIGSKLHEMYQDSDDYLLDLVKYVNENPDLLEVK